MMIVRYSARYLLDISRVRMVKSGGVQAMDVRLRRLTFRRRTAVPARGFLVPRHGRPKGGLVNRVPSQAKRPAAGFALGSSRSNRGGPASWRSPRRGNIWGDGDLSIEEDPAAALELLKRIIRADVPAAMIESHAMRLVGEPPAAIDNEARDLFEELQHQLPPFSRTEAFGLALALREIIRDKVRDIEGNAA
jgi:hypothetical protein